MKIADALNLLGLEPGCSQDQIKVAYKAACKKYHPDLNPAGLEMMKMVNAANDVLASYAGETPKGYESETNYGDKLWEALKTVITLNVNIEICGAWIWVTGNTYPNRDALKKAGYKFASKKQAWYFRPEVWASRSRGEWDLTDIREKYGSKVVKEETQQRKIS